MRAKLHLPNIPKMTMGSGKMLGGKAVKRSLMRTKNPTPFMSGSIAASQKRRMATSPRIPKKL